jgi:acyl transferase domain-containing protein/SAM-dependent methyltransferase
VSDFSERLSSLSPKRLALLAYELNEQLAREKAKTHQPIAIVGLACRFPGGADSPGELWRRLMSGDDLTGPAPSDRWRLDQPIAGLEGADGAPQRPRGGFLPRVDQFDPLFFGISPLEAETMDPQQRLLLEVVWEALENAAIPPASLRGSRTGVYVGIAGNDFAHTLLDQDEGELDSHIASGGSHAIAAGRIAYALDLAGPCMSIDTACSSSLVAVSAACDSLRIGRSTLALAGGVSLILSPETSVVLAKAGMLSPSFRCKSFDAGADGFARGEGCGVVVLKRLADAERDGDRIMAVIRGAAVNQDGRSAGLTAPNGQAQRSLLRDALADADLGPEQVQYVEAHGTGTHLGDPVEAQALAAVYGPTRPRDMPLWLGSIKANFGHLEAAAGVAGLIKLVLCLEHETIPPIAGLTTPNPHVDWEKSALALPTRPTQWPGPASSRVGGVSSFGFSGTNAHLLLSAPRPPPASTQALPDRSHHLLCLSAKSDTALRVLCGRYADHLERNPDIAISDLCATANEGRNHHPVRLAIVSRDIPELRMRLARTSAAQPRESRTAGEKSIEAPQIAFLFTGQGSQYFGMARQLYEAEPAFAATIDRCDEALRGEWAHGLKALLFSDGGDGGVRLDQTGYTQPALFSIEVALATFLMSLGVRPAAALGHSVGEYAAACAAGVFSIEDGSRLIARRARLMQALPPGGGMVAVLAPEADVLRAIAPFPALSVASFNGPGNSVVSGPLGDVHRLIRGLDASDTPHQLLTVSHAFHSALLEPMLDAFEREASKLSYGAPRFPIVSNLTGRIALGDDLRSGGYWRDHARRPVRFAEGIHTLRAMGCTAFVEIGPAPVLSGMARRIIGDPDGLWLPTLRKGRPDLDQLLDSLGQLYAKGATLDFVALNGGRANPKLPLPTYPFERSRYWPTIKPRAASPGAPTPATDQEPERDWLYDPVWRPAGDDGADRGASGFIADTGAIQKAIDDHIATSSRNQPGGHGDLGYEQLDRLCRDYILEALAKLGCVLVAGDVFSTDALGARLDIRVRHRRLFARLLTILAEDGVLAGDAAAWRVSVPPEPPASEARLRAMASGHAQFAAELAVLAPCGSRLAEVLQGRRDPLELLFPDGSLEAATRLYSEPEPVRIFNDLVARCIETAVGGLPPDRRLRVLEVGAGTGGTTARVLRHLPRDRTLYRFTDVSPRFLDAARLRFEDYDFVEYDLFDLDDPEPDMARLAGGFDIIIAANVVHATRDLRRSLEALRRRLAPGGLLVLLEVVRPQRLGDLTVGLTDGWWLFEDHDVRPDYALVSSAVWTRLLEETGFEGVLACPRPGQERDRLLSNQTILLAKRAPDTTSLSPARGESARGRWLIFADDGGLGRDLADRLRERGGQCLMVHHGGAYQQLGGDFRINPTDGSDHARLLRAFTGQDPEACRGVVYLWGLDAVFRDDAGPSAVLHAVERACRPALVAFQVMAEAPRFGGEVTVVTRGGRATHPTQAPARPAQAALWGMAGVVALEHPELSCRRVDLAGAAEAESLTDDLLRHEADEDQVASDRRLARSPRRL